MKDFNKRIFEGTSVTDFRSKMLDNELVVSSSFAFISSRQAHYNASIFGLFDFFIAWSLNVNICRSCSNEENKKKVDWIHGDLVVYWSVGMMMFDVAETIWVLFIRHKKTDKEATKSCKTLYRELKRNFWKELMLLC